MRAGAAPPPQGIYARFGRLTVITALLASLLTFGGAVSTPDGRAEAAPLEIFLANQGVYGPITVIGDSVLLGSGIYSPTLADQLVNNGWGPVRFRAGEGYSTGYFPGIWAVKASNWIRAWRAQGWDPPNVVVNLGANDAGSCGANKQCARNAILHLVDAIGPDRQIWWPQITRLYVHYGLMNAWNDALTEIAAERDNFNTWDWPTVMANDGYTSTDAIHLDPPGYRKRSARMAFEITAELARANRIGTNAALPEPASGRSRYVPLPPERMIDTRDDPPGRRPARSILRVDLGTRVPPDAVAVAVNVTAAAPAADGYVVAKPCSAPLAGSTVNFAANQSRGAMTTIPLDGGNEFCIYANVATDVIVDLQGVFVSGADADGFSPLATPRRLVDTRQGGRALTIAVPTPAGASAVAVNLTATNAASRGFLRAYPCDGDAPAVSNLNFGPGESVAGSAFVPTSDTNTICVSSNADVDVIVDLTGTFQPSKGLSFVPTPPTRMLDTRSGVGGWAPIQGVGQTLDVRVAPPDAEAVSGTLTMVRPLRRGYLSGYGCGARPTTSSVNALPFTVSANAITTGVSTSGRLCIYAAATTQTVFDTTGYWVR